MSTPQRLDESATPLGRPAPRSDEIPTSTFTTRTALHAMLAGNYVLLSVLALVSFAGGLLEAVFLVLVTKMAFSLIEGADALQLGWGPEIGQSTAVILALVLVIARIGLGLGASALSARLASGIIAHVRTELAGAFLSASWPLQQQERGGQLQDLLTTFTQQGSHLVASVTTSITAGFSIVAFLAMAFAVNPLGAIFVIAFIAVLGLLFRPLRAAIRRRAGRFQSASLDFATSLNEISQLGLELHVFEVQDEVEHQLEGLITHTASSERKVRFAQGSLPPLYTGLAYLSLIAVVGFVAGSHTSNLTALGSVLLVMLRSLTYAQSLQTSVATIALSVPFVERLQHQLALYRADRQDRDGAALAHIGVLKVDDVSYSYVEGQPVLRHVAFSIQPSEIVGIVGPSGSGKSTLVELMLGLRQPDKGRITSNGRVIAEYATSDWARKITFVPQRAHLIAGSVADNIRFYRPDVSSDDIERAAGLAHIREEIERFPEGFERELGAASGRLSGGQEQRICIARALVEQPDILILDEPTSSLDVHSENLIRQTLLELKERMTVIIIAHRLSTLDICDRIMVIQGGELRGFDTPERLERSSTFFREALELSGLR